MEDDRIDLDERSGETGFVNVQEGSPAMTFIAVDEEGRRTDTFQLDIEGSYEDLVESAQELVDFLKKHGDTHNFEAGPS